MSKFTDLDFQEKRFLSHLDSFSTEDQKRISQACSLAKEFHSGQERDEGGPYILHCLRVASCLIETLNVDDPDVICAALLHDTIEDTELSLGEIVKKLGRRTGEIVENLTREKKRDETLKNRYQRKYQKFLELMKKDKEVRTIKACDWLDNIESWPHLPEDHPSRQKFQRWFREAKKMYIPLTQTVDKRLVIKMKKALASIRRGY